MKTMTTAKLPLVNKLAIGAIVVAGLLVVLLVLLEFLLVPIINRTLDHSVKEVRVSITGVQLALWRGAYGVEGLTVQERKPTKKRLLMEVPSIDGAVDLPALLQGAFVGSMTLERPIVRLVIDMKDQGAALARDADVAQAIADLVPLHLNRVSVNDGRAHLMIPVEVPSGATRTVDLVIAAI
jgi:hypothetical protein